MQRTADVFVIIPFFQRTSGLLARAVASIVTQDVDRRCNIIVVDDGSPRPAEDELLQLAEEVRRAVTLIHQANAGAGAARNTGIEAVPPDATAIAFLDSDDTWSPDHLMRALAALENGADLYFAKTATMGEHERDDEVWPGAAEMHSTFTLPDTIRLNDSFLGYVLQRGLPLQTLVVKPHLCRSIRFPTHLKRAGEDLTFTFSLSRASSLSVFSSRVESVLGKGVNIYRSTLSHGSPHAIPRLLDELQSRLDLRKHVQSVPTLEQLNAHMQSLTLSSLAVQILHAAKRRRLRPLLQVTAYLCSRPIIAVQLTKEAALACWRKLVTPVV